MTRADPQGASSLFLQLAWFLSQERTHTVTIVPGIFKADERPLDMKDTVADHTGFTVFHQKLKMVRHLIGLLLMQHVTNQPQVHILCEKKDTVN